MSRRSKGEYGQNAQHKRGIVVDRDPKVMRVKVRFEDEDDTVSLWLDVLAKASGSSKSFMMPEIDDEVWCALDQKGEDGCIIGSKYNDKDATPFDGNDDVGFVFPGGSIHIDRAGGSVTVKSSGVVTIEAGRIILRGPVAIEGASITHNGTDIGDTHRHRDVEPGPSFTGVPA